MARPGAGARLTRPPRSPRPTRPIAAAIVLVWLAVASCASETEVLVEFRESEVAAALDASGLVFETPEERTQAIASFRTICVDTSPNSINDFSVYDMLVHPADYPPGFVETAAIGCPEKFATAREKLANGDCFGGVVAECDD